MSELFLAFGVNWELLIAQSVNFGIVLVALWYFLYKPMMTMLTKRQELVTKGVEDAEEARQTLARSDAEAAQRVSHADKEAEKIVLNARESAIAEKMQLIKDAEARALAIARDAEAHANELAARTKRESEKEIVQLAILAAEKVLSKKHD